VSETTTATGPAEPIEIQLDGVPVDELEEWLTTMLVIREFEDSLEPLTMSGNQIPGSVHQASGQEAVGVGAIRALEPRDIVASPHRPHHHALAKGLTPRSVMAELWGRATGCAGGRGGTMHLNDFQLGYYGSNGIVGASLGIAMGAALAAKLRRSGQVCLGFFGEGGANTGRTWEAVNFAAVQKLPLIAFCENNQYAVETFIGRSAALDDSIARRAAGFGLPAVQVDGQDVCAVYRATRAARERAALGEGPTFIEAVTYRFHGHNTGEVANYRTEEEVEQWRRTSDPLARLRRALEGAGRLESGRFDELAAAAKEVVEDAIRFAESSPLPDPATAADGVTALGFDPRGPVRWASR
jgi:TPP-dependent pyruvate/acetoin dehydrogenase alpha subunit